MSSITYTDNVTVIPAAWLNDVNTVAYTLFGDGSSYNGTFKLGTSGMTVTGTSAAWGFGVTPSAWSSGKALEVNIVGNGLWNANAASDIRVVANYAYISGLDKFAGTGYASRYDQANGVHTWYTSSASGTAGNNATMTTLMSLSTAGALTVADKVHAGIGTAAVAGGSNNYALVMGSDFVRITMGTGDPTLSAAKGSLYLRTDATTTTSRLWINTNGGTTWTYFTSAA